MSPYRKILTSFGIGALLGAIFTSWFAPQIIAWYFEPPVEIGVNCRPAVEWAMKRLQYTQVVGLIGGAIVAGIICAIWMRRKSN
jgi:hypothetical protein